MPQPPAHSLFVENYRTFLLWDDLAVPSVLDNGIRSPRKLLAAVVQRLLVALRR